jgi:heavy metal sensor kinase
MPIPSSLVSDRHVFDSHERTDAPRWRIVTRQVNAAAEGPLVVQVARSLESYDHEMGELLLALLLTGPLTLVVALGGGYFLARRALAPVDRMTETANRIEVKRLDQRLEVANPTDELGRLAKTLNGMLDRLEKSFREMRRFTADASHELRTPISVIRTEAEVALNKPVSDDDNQNLLSNILEECERLTWITDQLLTLSREDAGITQFRREPVDVGGLVRDVAETMRPLADAKNLCVEIAANGAAVVAGDADRLKQVVYNLLHNAIKYTPHSGRVNLAVERPGENILLAVHDTGVGIAPEHLPHVFERFYRVDKARTRAEGGTGLGLSIVDSIVAAHGGCVEIQSQPNEGTTVTVSFPSHRSTEQEPQS